MARDPTDRVEHRPWPLPPIPWIMAQTWTDVLFAHWPVAAGRLRPLVPEALLLEEFDGFAWVGIVPFQLTGLRLRGLPALPSASRFRELNVRTYVRLAPKSDAGAAPRSDDASTRKPARPGVYFFSLDAASRLAVWGARTFFRLPYHYAHMSIRSEGEWVQFESRRADETEPTSETRPRSADLSRQASAGEGKSAGGVDSDREAKSGTETGSESEAKSGSPARSGTETKGEDETRAQGGSGAALRVRYRPTGEVFRAEPGTLDHFLIERYCLYTVLRAGRVLRVDIHHHPWPLQRAEAEFQENTIARASRIELPDRPPVLHYARRQNTVNWPPTLVG